MSASAIPSIYELRSTGVTDPGAYRRAADQHKQQARSLITLVETEKRGLSDAEDAEFNRLATQAELLFDAADSLERSQKVAESRAGLGGQKVGGWQHTGGGETYQRGDRRTSWVSDMFSVATGRDAQGEASERLARNNREVETRALSTGAGAGGEFAPPGWLLNEYIAAVRAARPTADRVRNESLPMGISSVNIPKILTGTAVAQQANQNTAVQSTDATTGSVTAAILTIAGQQVVSQQEIDQSPVPIDEYLLEDLTADYAAKVDLMVLNNNATNAKGLLQITGTGTQTYTSASPTTGLLYSQIAQAINTVNTARFLGADTIVMHPRRWAAFNAALDNTSRPLVLPASGGPTNAEGIKANGNAQGVVGSLQGVDVVVDAQIPTNLGAGTNQDAIIVMRAADQVLWEGGLRAEAFRETKADQLSVLLRLYNYAAFTTRLPGSICVISGTGLVTPNYGA